MTRQTGEVVLIRIQFHQVTGSKIRPALVILGSGDDDFVAAPITSKPRSSVYDLAIQNWRSAGLNVPSTARIHKLSIMPKADILRILGHMSDQDKVAVLKLLCQTFCPSGLPQS